MADVQIVPDVVSKVTEKAKLTVAYNGKPISNGETLTPSEAQVPCHALYLVIGHGLVACVAC